LQCRIRREPTSIATNTYSTWNDAVTEVKKSHATMAHMVSDERTPSLPNWVPGAPALLYVFAYGTESTKMPSLSDSSSAIRPSPQLGFSSAIVLMSARRFLGKSGRPADRDFHRQNSRNPARCQRTNVLGVTIASACAQGKNRLKTPERSSQPVLAAVGGPSVPCKGRAGAGETNSLRSTPRESETRHEPRLEKPPTRPR